jgi:hypothetical protein
VSETARGQDAGRGPSLEQYVETRLSLLARVVEDQGAQSHSELVAFIDAMRVAVLAARTSELATQAATDLRYQQRFEAQSDALAAAFLSQQTAMQTAFVVAEKAVQAALAAADRAVSKAELAADKRFEALNELRSMLNDMVATLMTRAEAVQRFDAMAEKIDAGRQRTDMLEGRLNVQAGGAEGGREAKGDYRNTILIIATVLAGLIGLYAFVQRIGGVK